MLTIQALNYNFKIFYNTNNIKNSCLYTKEEEKSISNKFDY